MLVSIMAVGQQSNTFGGIYTGSVIKIERYGKILPEKERLVIGHPISPSDNFDTKNLTFDNMLCCETKVLDRVAHTPMTNLDFVKGTYLPFYRTDLLDLGELTDFVKDLKSQIKELKLEIDELKKKGIISLKF